MQVWFLEELGIVQVAIGALLRRRVFYSRESIGIRVLKRFAGLRLPRGFKTIWFGDVHYASGVRRSAYEYARGGAKAVVDQWSAPSLLGAIDYKLLFEKHVVECIYGPAEFVRFTARYIQENPGNDYLVTIDECTEVPPELSALKVPIQKIVKFESWQYLLAVALIRFHYVALRLRHFADRPAKAYAASLLCEVSTPRVKDMYDEVFQGWSPEYLVARPYLSYFSGDQSLQVFKKDRKTGRHLEELKRIVVDVIALLKNNSSALSGAGGDGFSFYKKIYDGLNRCPDAKGSVYVTYEHGSLANFARNEILRAWGNVSVFLPYDVYVIDHYYVPEYRYNYDILCSSGPLLERIYAMQECKTQKFLQIGAYWQAKAWQYRHPTDRKNTLDKPTGTTIITFLSTGIQDETISGESRLMDLALRVSEIPGVTVVIRPKPQPPKPGYENYLHNKFQAAKNVIVSGADASLLSLLDFTDLFVTGMSSSAVDLCICGGAFYSVDFWKDPDMYLWQTLECGVFIPEESALETIRSWVIDVNRGARLAHAERMNRLRDELSYPVVDVERFQRSLQQQLLKTLQQFPVLSAFGREKSSETTNLQICDLQSRECRPAQMS